MHKAINLNCFLSDIFGRQLLLIEEIMANERGVCYCLFKSISIIDIALLKMVVVRGIAVTVSKKSTTRVYFTSNGCRGSEKAWSHQNSLKPTHGLCISIEFLLKLLFCLAFFYSFSLQLERKKSIKFQSNAHQVGTALVKNNGKCAQQEQWVLHQK